MVKHWDLHELKQAALWIEEGNQVDSLTERRKFELADRFSYFGGQARFAFDSRLPALKHLPRGKLVLTGLDLRLSVPAIRCTDH